MKLLLTCLIVSLRLLNAYPTSDDHQEEVDGETSRKIIGQSVVTSVSVITNGDGDPPHFTDAVGKTVQRPFVPPQVASPINLLNPDRYEFYTFNDAGELVKRLMTLKEIQSIVANGNGAMIGDNEPESSQSVIHNTIPLSNQGSETKVQDIVDNVQNVLSREMENNKNASQIHSFLLDTPDVSSSWSMILPAIFGNIANGDEILPHKPINMTPETEIEETTTTKRVQSTRRPISKAPMTTTRMPTRPTTLSKVPASIVNASNVPTKAASSSTISSTESSSTSQPSSTKIQTTTMNQTLKAKPNTTSFTKLTMPTTKPTSPSTNRVVQTKITTMEVKKTTSKVTPTKKLVKKPTSPGYKRPITNSPIIIEKIPRRPVNVESKTETNFVERNTEKVVISSTSTTSSSTTKSSTSVAPSTTVASKTEAPTTTAKPQISSYKTNLPSTTTTENSVKMTTTEQTMLSTSEEDRQDSAINQIIGSLQSNLFNTYDMATTQSSVEEATNDAAMDRLGDLNLVPDKVVLNDHLFIDETDPILKDLPTTSTTVTPPASSSSSKPMNENLDTTSENTKSSYNNDDNSEVMQKIEMLIKETNSKSEKLDALSFDDDDETEIKFKDTLETSKPIKHSEFVHKAATVASILSTRTTEKTTTTTSSSLSEESDTTVPTILSDALSNVIQLMIAQQESEKETERPIISTTTPLSDEPSGYDLTQVLQHYQDLNFKQDQIEPLSLVSENLITTEQPKVESTTMKQESDEVSHETMIVKETSSKSIEKGEGSDSENTTSQPDIKEVTTDASKEEFLTFFFIENAQDETTTLDPHGEFSTQQYVETVKRLSDRKDEQFSTTNVPFESDEESSELVSDVLNQIGIANDSEEEESSEKLKGAESHETEEVENAILSLTSEIGNTLTNDVKTDFKLTSKIANSLISVADSISETLNEDEEESEEVTTLVTTTVVPDVKQDQSTEKSDEVEDSTEKKDETQSTETTNSNESTEQISLENDTKPTEKVVIASSTNAIEGNKPKSPNQLVQLSVIRKDNSLEEIDFITPSTPTSTRIPITEGNFIKIENIETTSFPKPTHTKIKGHEAFENIKPIFISVRGTTTSKSNLITNTLPKKASIKKDKQDEIAEIDTQTQPTVRVPLIEVTKSVISPIQLSSTEDNLVEIKVQTKPTTIAPTSSETHLPTTNYFVSSNAQTIKNTIKNSQQHVRPQSPPVDLSAAPKESLGLAASTQNLNNDLSDFSKLCNELAFSFWKSITADGISQSRSVIISPFALTSTLSMIFLGARGQTSGEMNDLLKLDDMVTFNPHVIFRNISESIEQSRNSGIAAAAFVRELYSDRSKGKLLPYFKEKAQQFYGAHVEEVNFNVINDILRRRTNLLVKRHTFSKLNEYLKTNNIWVNEPLAAVSANVFLTDCSGTSTSERDGEMFFQVSPAIRQRRLIPIPAAVYRSGFTAGYDPILDATAVAFGDDLQSTIMVMPGQQGSLIPGDTLERLENAFIDPSNNAWARLLKTFIERPGLEVQIPRFSHRSLINTTYALQQMGLKDIFDSNKADLRGLTGAKSNDLFFSDMMQINQFSTCGEEKIADLHHIEIYPSPSLKRHLDEGEDEDGKLEISSTDKNQNQQYKPLFYDPIYDQRYMNVPLPLRPRQARLPENPRLRFDRPFIYFVRHNPTGIILFMGRFNPRLLP